MTRSPIRVAGVPRPSEPARRKLISRTDEVAAPGVGVVPRGIVWSPQGPVSKDQQQGLR